MALPGVVWANDVAGRASSAIKSASTRILMLVKRLVIGSVPPEAWRGLRVGCGGVVVIDSSEPPLGVAELGLGDRVPRYVLEVEFHAPAGFVGGVQRKACG